MGRDAAHLLSYVTRGLDVPGLNSIGLEGTKVDLVEQGMDWIDWLELTKYSLARMSLVRLG